MHCDIIRSPVKKKVYFVPKMALENKFKLGFHLKESNFKV